MKRLTSQGRGRIAVGGIAAAMIVSGLALAVGAGAQGGGSARDAAYPVTYAYKVHIDGHPPKVQSALASAASASARFRFHLTFSNGDPVPQVSLKYYKYKCKLDGRSYRKCRSPKRYRGLGKGKHVFRVKAQFLSGSDASPPAKFKWRIN